MARTYISALTRQHNDLLIDTLDLWRENVPAFDGDKAAAKMTFFGVGELEGKLRTAWDEVLEVIERFTSADHYVISSPMWNGGIPYRLKQYIDVITQPGLLFGFDSEAGYNGLLRDKSATLVLTAGVWSPGAPEGFGTDFQERYLDWWLRLIGIDDIETLSFRPSMLQADPATAFSATLQAARDAA